MGGPAPPDLEFFPAAEGEGAPNGLSAGLCYSVDMTTAATPVKRSDALLYFMGVVLSVPTLISLIHRQLHLPIAPDVQQFIATYRAVADGVSAVIHAPLRGLSLTPPAPLIDLHLLSFAGMGMMTKALEAPGEQKDAWHGMVWGVTSFCLAYLLVGILVFGANVAALIANPLKPFHSDQWIETTPVLEGPQGRLRRERTYRLERDLSRITANTLVLVGGYFVLNWVLLNQIMA